MRKDEYFREFLENPSDVIPFPPSLLDGPTSLPFLYVTL